MNNRRFIASAAVLIAGLMFSSTHADPCGMVPPVYVGEGVPIARIGEQKTYVYYKNGIETFVIRPGFTGKVDQFGMLIPFPTPPAVRKVPDNVFPQIAAAIDPPEVVIYGVVFELAADASAVVDQAGNGLAVNRNEVRVLREEAVGMYEVAVLEAGSAEALKKWMDKHGYRYPDGMDTVCEDYVDDGWCFVAVKTKVGTKQGVDPQPGQRTVDPKLPSGATFDGHVQAMGFRFKTDELVVPMRLSAFNDGELRNIVYLLTDGPRKVRSIPEEYVVRQLTGQELYDNLTKPLPVRIVGGNEADVLKQYGEDWVKQQRDPEPKNGVAKILFASDLLASGSNRLSFAEEEREKELLAIGERLGLRGKEIDDVNAKALKEESDKTVHQSLDLIKKMTLTVVDGDFPREVLAGQNLTFAEFRMPNRRNNPASYDANQMGPAPKKEGVLKTGALQMPGRKATLPADAVVLTIWSVVVAVFFIRKPNKSQKAS